MREQEGEADDGSAGRYGGLLLEGSYGLSTTDCVRCVLQLLAQPPAARGGTLIVVAPARLSFWVEAFARYAPRLVVIVHHGAGRARNACVLRGADVVVSTYSLVAAAELTLRADDVLATHEAEGAAVWRRRAVGGAGDVAAPDASMLHLPRWGRVIFDEADRHLARPTTKRSRAAALLIAPRRWGLTGIAARARREVRELVLRSIGL